MAIPFFILAGTFLTRGGGARRMIDFTTSLVGHLPGGLGLAGVVACAMFAAISGSSAWRRWSRSAPSAMPAMVEHGYPRRFGVGRDLDFRRARHPGAAVDHPGCWGYGVSTNDFDRRTVHCRASFPASRLACMLAAVTSVHRLAPGLSADAARNLHAAMEGVSRKPLGAAADRHGARWNLRRHLHAHRGGRHCGAWMPSSSRCSSTGNSS